MSKLTFNLPLNSTSLGQVSLCILRELFLKKKEILLFPIGNVDISTQTQDEDFNKWITESIYKSTRFHDRTNPIFKLWHLAGSLESYSNKQILFSFYEVDSPTPTEVNIVKNNSLVLFSSNYSVSIFNNMGCNNVKYVPLGFDSYHFKQIATPSKKEGIHFGLFGKLEPQRKRHLKVLQNWIKKYGNKHGYFLNCAIFNHFIDPNVQSQIINQALNGERYWNINFLNYMPSNEMYNSLLNNTDIILAMSGGEGWGLPEFQTVALGKHCIGLNAHAYKDWMDNKNAVIINPNSKIPVYDNLFFKPGMEYNQGNIFDWSDQDFINGLDAVESRYKANPINTVGLELQTKYTYSNMINSILDMMENI